MSKVYNFWIDWRMKPIEVKQSQLGYGLSPQSGIKWVEYTDSQGTRCYINLDRVYLIEEYDE